MDWPDYAKLNWKAGEHHRRFVAHITAMQRKLICQECRGRGGWTERILDDGTGPREQCDWCEGTGYVTSWLRGQWLRLKREAKAA
jgi:DnaJ-class molecular chaperone